MAVRILEYHSQIPHILSTNGGLYHNMVISSNFRNAGNVGDFNIASRILGFRFWGLGFRIFGLEFGVWGIKVLGSVLPPPSSSLQQGP